MTDEQVVAPADPADNVTPAPQEQSPAPAEPADNAEPPQEPPKMVQLPPEKVAEYKRKFTASKDEALRLKRENEDLKAKLSTPQQPAVPSQPYVNPNDIEYFKELGKLAGVTFQEDVQSLKQETYQDKKTAAVQQFLANHPEYAKPGDEQSDALWMALEEKVNRYRAPTDPTEWSDLLEEGHKVLHYDTTTAYEKGKALGYAQANVQDKSRVGGGSGGTPPSAQKVSPQKKQIMDEFKRARPQYYQ